MCFSQDAFIHLGCGTQKTPLGLKFSIFFWVFQMDGILHQYLSVEQSNKFIKVDSYETVHRQILFSSGDREKDRE